MLRRTGRRDCRHASWRGIDFLGAAVFKRKRLARAQAAAAAGTALSALGCAAALAQDFPSRAVRIVVPYAPSGNVDITARTLVPTFSEALGQQIIVENRAGAGGTIGTAAVAKSPADGYTLLLGSSGTVTAGPAVYKNLSFDPIRDFVAVGPIQSVPMVLTAAPKTPVSSFKELLAYAKSKGSAVSMASAGTGSSNHLALELLAREANFPVLHVPYKGSGPALTDLLGSQVETMMDQLTASIEHIRNGRIKPLAVSSRQRSPQLPNVPTLDELGVTGYEASTFTGLFAPSGLQPAVMDKLQVALRKALANESVRERYRSMGVEMMDMNPADFAAYVRADLEKWRRVAREANIVVD
jgi:tripartite-type tricarboxylate transporter receptor subunit TctC